MDGWAGWYAVGEASEWIGVVGGQTDEWAGG